MTPSSPPISRGFFTTVGRKMAFMIFVNSLLVIGGMALAITNYRSLLKDSQQVLAATQESLLTLKKAQLEIERFKNLRAGDPLKAVEALRALQHAVKAFSDQTAKRLAEAPQDRLLLQVLQDGQVKVEAVKARVDEALFQGQIRNLAEWTGFLTDVLEAMTKQVEQYQGDATGRIEQRTHSTQVFIIIGVMILVAAMIALSGWIAWGIAGTATQLAHAMSTIQKEGDLTKVVRVKSQDELGVLAQSFNALLASLADIVKRIRATADQVSGTVRGFVTTVSVLDQASQTISESVEGMAKVSTIQARQVDKTHQTIEALLLSITKVASKAQAASEQAARSNQAAERGGQAFKASTQKIHHIQQSFQETALVIKQLGERSRQIGQIVEVITKIAEETNMLALNTSIEAARAGDTASGFGVVAEEVRQLADKTARAAEEITKIVKEIQTETGRAVTAVESGVHELAEGTTLIQHAGVELDTLVKIVWEVSRVAEDISKMTQEQATSCQDVRRSMAAVTAAAEENMRASNEALKSAAQQTELTKSIITVSNELSKVSQDLVEAVKTFKVEP